MPQARAVFAYVMALAFSLTASFAQSTKGEGAPTGGKSPVFIRAVKFDQLKIGNQPNPWNHMIVELQANFNPDTKEPKEGKKAANKQWVDKIKVTVTQIYKGQNAKDATEFNYYRASATVLTMEVNQPRSVSFYLPGDIVKRDRLRKEPDYYFVQLEVGGSELPIYDEKGKIIADQTLAVHKQILPKNLFDTAKDSADRGVGSNPGILRPQYLLIYPMEASVPPSPEFIREDAGSR